LIAGALLIFPGAGRALADPPSITIDQPAGDSTKSAAFAISGSAHQDGTDAVITSIKITLADEDGWITPVEQNYTGTAGGVFSGGGDSVSFNWTNIGASIAKYNGPYTVTVKAYGQYRTTFSGTQTVNNTVINTFHVVIPPATPSGVSATKPDDSTVATIKWTKNAEPDLYGYKIYRSYAGASAKPVGEVDATKTSFTDDLAGQPAGQYKYGVYAVRHARSCKSPNNVDTECTRPINSAQAGQSGSVTVRGQTTTTTTIKKSTGGGSSSGGSSSGGSTSGGSSSGGTTSGGSTSGTGTRSGTARSGNTGGFAPGGDVDLSQFGSLLNPKARNGSSSGSPREADGTYDPTLPYGERPLSKPKDDNTLISIGGADIPAPSDDWVKFIGAGALVTSLLVHVLWFKQQVDRIPLEAID
jgi:hypothetical protein